MDVIDLDDHRREWDYDYVKCEFCDKTWVSVYHYESEKLQCPKCRKMTRIFVWSEE